VTDLLHY